MEPFIYSFVHLLFIYLYICLYIYVFSYLLIYSLSELFHFVYFILFALFLSVGKVYAALYDLDKDDLGIVSAEQVLFIFMDQVFLFNFIVITHHVPRQENSSTDWMRKIAYYSIIKLRNLPYDLYLFTVLYL